MGIWYSRCLGPSVFYGEEWKLANMYIENSNVATNEIRRCVPLYEANIPHQNSMIQASKVLTSCLSRIMVRSNGIMHVISNGPQELSFENSHVSKLHIELLNSDGSYHHKIAL